VERPDQLLCVPSGRQEQAVREEMADGTDGEHGPGSAALSRRQEDDADEDTEERATTSVETPPVERDAEELLYTVTREQELDLDHVWNERSDHADRDVLIREPLVPPREESTDTVRDEDVCKQVRHRCWSPSDRVRSGGSSWYLGWMGASPWARTRVSID